MGGLVAVATGLAGCSAGERTAAEGQVLASSYRQLMMHQQPEYFSFGAASAASVYTSEPIESAFAFDEALLSWNIRTQTGQSAVIEMRVGAGEPEVSWSPWLFVGDWPGPTGRDANEKLVTSFEMDVPVRKAPATRLGGKIDVDFFVASVGSRFTHAQYRITLAQTGSAEAATAKSSIERVALTFSSSAAADARYGGDINSGPGTFRTGMPLADSAQPARVALAVPLRSQKTERREIAGRICSPTSVSMVLAAYGSSIDVLSMANLAYDARHDLYGNWPRNVQAAFSSGTPGFVTRIGTWREVEDYLTLGWPLVISIATKSHELRGAPYPATDGHLVVIRGIDANGNVLVNDPAATTPEQAAVTYNRTDLEHVWLRRNLGTAYVLMGQVTQRPRAQGVGQKGAGKSGY